MIILVGSPNPELMRVIAHHATHGIAITVVVTERAAPKEDVIPRITADFVALAAAKAAAPLPEPDPEPELAVTPAPNRLPRTVSRIKRHVIWDYG
jgi:hypothetical protein